MGGARRCGRGVRRRWRRLSGIRDSGPGRIHLVSVTPVRVLDTCDPVNLGLAGPFVSGISLKLPIVGSIANSGGTSVVVPMGSTGVLLNVTAVAPTANGFISIRPGDASGAPSTSSLNVSAGENIPNAVQVALRTTGVGAGEIDITYDAYGSAGAITDLLIDVVGYTTNSGIQSLAAELSTKSNAADVYSKTQIDTSNANSICRGVITALGEVAATRAHFGTFHSTHMDTGTYIIWIDGLRPNCIGLTPFIQLTSFGSSAAIVSSQEVATQCSSGNTLFIVETMTPAGNAANRPFSRDRRRRRSLSIVLEAIRLACRR